jgi:hypothetical protein
MYCGSRLTTKEIFFHSPSGINRGNKNSKKIVFLKVKAFGAIDYISSTKFFVKYVKNQEGEEDLRARHIRHYL